VIPRKFKIVAAVALVVIVGLIVFYRSREWPALPNSPVALGELIEKSDLIVQAKVMKVDGPQAAVYAGTNRWIQRVVRAVGGLDRKVATVHLEVMQGVKGPALDRVAADYPVEFARTPTLTKDSSAEGVIVFLYRQRGAYHPVAYSYGTKSLSGKEADIVLRWVGELVAADKMGGRERERYRAEWFVRLMENPTMRWDGVASWLSGSGKAGEALSKLPADLAKRVEAVAFRDEPLGGGDEMLLREFAPMHPKPVVRRILSYFSYARSWQSESELQEPWRCIGAVELLIRIAAMPKEFKDRFDASPYPDVGTPSARAQFFRAYLPEVEKRLTEAGLAEDHFKMNEL
jgi:hypothetical protein